MDKARDFDAVFAAELDEIARRHGSERPPPPPDAQPSSRLGLTGLALSGGGIRSAAFSLGVVQPWSITPAAATSSVTITGTKGAPAVKSSVATSAGICGTDVAM